MKGNINMQKEKRQTLNADKRKVIADIFSNILKIIQNIKNNIVRQYQLTMICVLLQKQKWKLL